MPTNTPAPKRITSRHKVWKNLKYPNRTYNGSYEYVTNKKTGEKERLLLLTEIKSNPKSKRKPHTSYCDSPEDAKDNKGWKNVER